jgi:hypothetical protein
LLFPNNVLVVSLCSLALQEPARKNFCAASMLCVACHLYPEFAH